MPFAKFPIEGKCNVNHCRPSMRTLYGRARRIHQKCKSASSLQKKDMQTMLFLVFLNFLFSWFKARVTSTSEHCFSLHVEHFHHSQWWTTFCVAHCDCVHSLNTQYNMLVKQLETLLFWIPITSCAHFWLSYLVNNRNPSADPTRAADPTMNLRTCTHSEACPTVM